MQTMSSPASSDKEPSTVHPIVVALASRSLIKITAVQDALGSLVIGDNGQPTIVLDRLVKGQLTQWPTTIIPVETESGVSEQPREWSEIAQGANNRCANLAFILSKFDICIAIENGIFSAQIESSVQEERWVDAAWITIIDRKSGKRYHATSVGVALPPAVIEQFQAQSPTLPTLTVGGVIAGNNPSANHNDPHCHLTGGAVTRTCLLTQAVVTCLSQWVLDQRSSAEVS